MTGGGVQTPGFMGHGKHFISFIYIFIRTKVLINWSFLYTDPAECTRIRHEVAIPVFDKRDARLENLTDETVDVYYSCILCQAFSPSHVCVVTPERLGLCGAVSWLDAKATNELDPA